MKRVVLFFCLAVFAAGCASLTANQMVTQQRENLSKLSVGMCRSDAIALMGSCPVAITCSKGSGKSEELSVAHPYRTEILQVADKKLEVISYVISIGDDCKIDEANLMPLVFENEKLIGWGNDFLQGLKK